MEIRYGLIWLETLTDNEVYYLRAEELGFLFCGVPERACVEYSTSAYTVSLQGVPGDHRYILVATLVLVYDMA